MSLDLHHLLAPYVLDSLEPDDRSRFEVHLAQCELCRSELPGFCETAARIGEAEAQTPPPALRERLMTMASTTQQEHPVVTAFAQRSRMRRTLPRLALAAAAVVAAVSIGGYVSEHERAGDLSADQNHLTTVVSAADAAMTEGAAIGGGKVRVIASPSHDAAVVVGTSLTDLKSDQTYQVWRMHDGQPTSVGLLGRRSGLLYVDTLDGADAFAITVEPKGGSKQPTSKPIFSTPV